MQLTHFFKPGEIQPDEGGVPHPPARSRRAW